jgi:hypothetical protein
MACSQVISAHELPLLLQGQQENVAHALLATLKVWAGGTFAGVDDCPFAIKCGLCSLSKRWGGSAKEPNSGK